MEKRYEGLSSNNDIKYFTEWRNRTYEMLSAILPRWEEDVNIADDLEIQIERVLQNFDLGRDFLEEFKDDKEILEALILNVASVKGKTRRSGKLYSSHPIQVGMTILKIADDLSSEIRKECTLVSLTHDIIEEGNIEDPQDFLNKKFPQLSLGDMAIILMEPELPHNLIEFDKHTVVYSYMAEQLKRHANSSVVNVEISDRLDDILDLDYIIKSDQTLEQKKKRVIKKISKAKFTIDFITNNNDFASFKLLNTFNKAIDYIISNAREIIGIEITKEEVYCQCNEFNNYLSSNMSQVKKVIKEYLAGKSIFY